jgi:hypothetical protein
VLFICSLKVCDEVVLVIKEGLIVNRIFLSQPFPDGASTRSFRTIVEGICAFRLEIPNF